ncbi:MAG: hypothetical protein IKW96_14530 [Ruminococcus sp.]|uniref:hypothetical protein n=1 Tax=Ruminococcus sp. TaxID=41978 RepID=UPI0025DECB4C|nr:hypothetical protein [Ruminococcus sp.]MBR5684467.1 hypothetical protein [Ruminococcus sp.]
MKKSEKILLIISAVLTAVGAVSVIFAWASAFLLAVGISMGFCTVLSHFLGKSSAEKMPWWLVLLFILSFLPAALCIYWSADAGINGTGGSMIFREKHGWEAFSETLFISSFLMTVFPVIPMAVIVQVKFIKRIISIRKHYRERS